jgi:hypothetical protein
MIPNEMRAKPNEIATTSKTAIKVPREFGRSVVRKEWRTVS